MLFRFLKLMLEKCLNLVLKVQSIESTLIHEALERHPFNGLFFQGNLGKPAPER